VYIVISFDLMLIAVALIRIKV